MTDFTFAIQRIFCCIFLCAAISACALTTDSIDIPYQPAAHASPVAGADSVTVSVAGSDGRTTYRDRVSSKKNGYGMEMAAITASNDIPDTVRSAVEQELAARGYKIGPKNVQVSVEVVKFYNDYKTGFFSGDANAEVAFNVKVARPDQSLVFSKYYSGSGTEPNVQLANGSNARAALIVALRAAVASLVNDPDFLHAVTAARGQSDPGTGKPAS